MKVKLLTSLSGPHGSWAVGEVVDMDDDTALGFFERAFGEPVDGDYVPAPMPVEPEGEPEESIPADEPNESEPEAPADEVPAEVPADEPVAEAKKLGFFGR